MKTTNQRRHRDGGNGSAGAAKGTEIDKATFALTLLTFFICCGGWLWFALDFPETAWDFTEFYIAGNIPVGSLYDQAVFRDYGERELAPLGIDYYPPYVRPAVFSLPLRTLVWLPYWTAFAIWAFLQFAFYLGSLAALRTRFRFPMELLAGFGLFYPGMFGIITGQDAHGLSLLLVLGLLLLLKGNQRAAGAVLAAGFYKFNLTLLIPLLLLLKKQHDAFRWLVVTGALLALASILLNPPGQYLDLLANISSYTIGFSPSNMISLRGLAHSLDLPALYYLFAAIAGVVSVIGMQRLPLAEGFCVGLLGSMLCSYHGNWYDGTLLVIPIAVAFSRSSKAAKAFASLLLFVFPLWPASSETIVVLIALLFFAFVRPIVKQGEPVIH